MDIILIGSLIAAVAAFAQAITGFGFALVLVPLLALVIDPKVAVVVSVSLGLVSKVPILVQDWRHVEFRKILPLSLAALVGILGGVQLLLTTDPYLLKLLIGIVVVALSVPLLFEIRRPIKRDGLATFVVGLTSGVLNGATSMGGPPVVLFGVNQGWPKTTFRVNLCAFFVITNVFTLIVYALNGKVTLEVLGLDALLVPAVLIGFLAGNKLFPRLSGPRFRRLVIFLVIATGVVSGVAGARALGLL